MVPAAVITVANCRTMYRKKVPDCRDCEREILTIGGFSLTARISIRWIVVDAAARMLKGSCGPDIRDGRSRVKEGERDPLAWLFGKIAWQNGNYNQENLALAGG